MSWLKLGLLSNHTFCSFGVQFHLPCLVFQSAPKNSCLKNQIVVFDSFDLIKNHSVRLKHKQMHQHTPGVLSHHVCETCGQKIPSVKDIPGPSSRSQKLGRHFKLTYKLLNSRTYPFKYPMYHVIFTFRIRSRYVST